MSAKSNLLDATCTPRVCAGPIMTQIARQVSRNLCRKCARIINLNAHPPSLPPPSSPHLRPFRYFLGARICPYAMTTEPARVVPVPAPVTPAETASGTQTTTPTDDITPDEDVLHIVLLEQLRPENRLQPLAGYSAPRFYHWGLDLTPDIAFIHNIEDRRRLAGAGMAWNLDGVDVVVWFSYTDGYMLPRMRKEGRRRTLRSGQPKLGVPIWVVVVVGEGTPASFASMSPRLRRLPLSTFMKEGKERNWVNKNDIQPYVKLFDANKKSLTTATLKGIEIFLTRKQILAADNAAEVAKARLKLLDERSEARAEKKASAARRKRKLQLQVTKRKTAALAKRRRADRRIRDNKRKTDQKKAEALLAASLRRQIRQELLEEAAEKSAAEQLEVAAAAEKATARAAAEARISAETTAKVRAEISATMRKEAAVRKALEDQIRQDLEKKCGWDTLHGSGSPPHQSTRAMV